MYMKYAIDQQMVVISAQNPVSIEFHRRQFINVQQIWVQRLFEWFEHILLFENKGIGHKFLKLRTVQKSGVGAEPQELSLRFCRSNMLIIVAY